MKLRDAAKVFSNRRLKQEFAEAHARPDSLASPEAILNRHVADLSIQALMGDDVESGYRLSGSAESVLQERRNKREKDRQFSVREFVRWMNEQLAEIENKIKELEETINALREAAEDAQRFAFFMFQRADRMETLMFGGIEDCERDEAIELLIDAGHDEDIRFASNDHLESLLERQIDVDRESAATLHENADEMRDLADEAEAELKERKNEANTLRERLDGFTSDPNEAADLAQATEQLQRDVQRFTDQTDNLKVRIEAALQSAATAEPDDGFDIDAELASSRVPVVNPAP